MLKKKIWAIFHGTFYQKFVIKLSKKRVWDPGPEVKKAPDPGSAKLQKTKTNYATYLSSFSMSFSRSTTVPRNLTSFSTAVSPPAAPAAPPASPFPPPGMYCLNPFASSSTDSCFPGVGVSAA